MTTDKLENARRDLQKWEDRFANYSGNNPDKYQADIRAARRRVRALEDALKASGELPRSEQEQLWADLDRAFPHAKSREEVQFQGKRFQRRFFPLERSRSGKSVNEWGKEWIELKGDFRTKLAEHDASA